MSNQAGRIKTMGMNAFRQMLVPLGNMLIALLVVRLVAPELWGAFVKVKVWIALGAQVAMWGSKEFLLRKFSQTPSAIARLWPSNLISRIPALLIGALPVLLLVDAPLALPALAWMVVLMILQSFEVLVIYTRKFLPTIIVELVAILATVTVLLLWNTAISLTDLLYVFLAVHALKLVGYGWLFQSTLFGKRTWFFDIKQLLGATFFFGLTLTGMLQSRSDLYIVTLLLPDDTTAFYHVWISLMFYIQGVAYYILLPYVKNIYRVPLATLKKIRWNVAKLGLLLVPAGLLVAGLIATFGFGFQLSPGLMAVSALIVIPEFLHLPLVYSCFRCQGEKHMLVINVAAFIVNAGLSWWLIMRYGFLGALIASAAAQWLIYLALQILWTTRWQPALSGKIFETEPLKVDAIYGK